jgi:uncharacterized protein
MNMQEGQETQTETPAIAVHKDVELIHINEISKNSWNPNFVTDSMMSAITDDISRNGFIGPIVLQRHNKKLNKDYVIINGEHRYRAFVELKISDRIPCTVLDVDDKTAEILTLRLNREHGELMPDKVSMLLNDLLVGVESQNEQENIEILRRMTAMNDAELSMLRQLDLSPERMLGEAAKPKEDENAIYFNWENIDSFAVVATNRLKQRIESPQEEFDWIVAIPNGGLIPARIVARELNFFEHKDHHDKNILTYLPEVGKIERKVLVVDDIYDEGVTYDRVSEILGDNNFEYLTLISRNGINFKNNLTIGHDLAGDTRWVIFPWEYRQEQIREDVNSALRK